MKKINNRERDYYEILGVDRNVSQSDLKGLQRLAVKYHPDKNLETRG